MSEEVVKTIRCDMCGDVIDTSDEEVLKNSAISGGYYSVIVHEHNESYQEGLMDSIGYSAIDLCPKCADRAAAIHLEITPTEGGRSCKHELSWREGR